LKNMMKYSVHSVKYNFIMNCILSASNFIFPLITFPYIARILHASGNGKVDFAASVVNYFVMLASMGIPTYGIRACAKVRDDKDKLSKTAQEILIINFISTLIVFFTFIVCIFCVPQFRQDKTLFIIEGVNIILNLFGVNWFYQALEKYDYITLRSILFKALALVLIFIFIHKASDYKLYASITVLASGGANIVNFIRLSHFISLKRIGDYNLKRHIGPILVLFAQSATISVYTNMDTVMLGFLRTSRDVGLYAASVKVKNVLLGVVASLGNVMLPRMSYYVQNKAKNEFNELLLKALNVEVLLAFPLAIFFSYESKDCILILAGNGYIEAVTAMRIINFAIIPNGLTGIIGTQTLIALNREKQVLISVIFGAISDFVLNLICIPYYGATGAAIATLIAEWLVLLVQLILGKDIVGASIKRVSYAKYGILSLLSLSLIFILSLLWDYNAPVKFFVNAIVFFFVYFFGLVVTKDEFVTDKGQN